MYRHIAQILKRSTHPPPAPIIEPSSPTSAPRVEPSPTQQAYQPAAPALRVELSPTQQAYRPAAPAPRVETPKPPAITNTRREVLCKLVQQSLRRSKRLRLPTQRCGPRSVFQAAQSVIENSVSDDDIERLFSHHIAAHVHCPVTGRKLNIRKLRKGSDGHIWDYSLFTEWVCLLPNGLRNNGPPEKRVCGTVTVFPFNAPNSRLDEKFPMATSSAM